MSLDGRLGLVIDGTGKDFAKIKKQVDMVRGLGYSVHMIFVNTDLETDLVLAAAQEIQGILDIPVRSYIARNKDIGI